MFRLFILFLVSVSFFSFSEGKQQETSSVVKYGVFGQAAVNKELVAHLKLPPAEGVPIGYLDFPTNYLINEGSLIYVKGALDYFVEQKVAFVILHLDTLGGMLFPAIQISEMLQKFDLIHGIPCIAFIDSRAIGSGALIAYSCRFIVTNPQSIMGGELPGLKIGFHAFPPDVLPYLLAEFADAAAFFSRDPIIAEAMVDQKMIVIERNGKILRLYDKVELKPNDIIISRDSFCTTLTSEQLLKYGIADFQVNGSIKTLIKEPVSFEQIPLSKESTLSQFSKSQVLPYGSWKTAFFLFLTYPLVSAVLLFFLIVLFYIQVKTKKLTFLTPLIIFLMLGILGTSVIIQSASWIEILFLFVGLMIIFFDAFFGKGRHTLGFLGIGLCIVSLFMMLMPGFQKLSLLDFEAFSFTARSITQRVLWLGLALLSASVSILFIEKRLFQSKKNNKNFPKEVEEEKVISLEIGNNKELPNLQSVGIAHCSLRPDGKVLINDKIYDAVTKDGSTILRKTPIVVVKHEENRVVVEQQNKET